SVAGWPTSLPTQLTLPKQHEAELPDGLAHDDNRFTEGLVEVFVDALTGPGDVVLDPFAGFGTTLLAAERRGRQGWGVEIDAARAEYIRARVEHRERVLVADVRRLSTLDLPPARLVLTSPPYSNPGDPRDALSGYVAANKGYGAYLAQLAKLFADLRDSMLP